MVRLRSAFFLGIPVLLAACGGAGQPAPEASSAAAAATENAAAPYRNVEAGVDFVGDAACFDCHEDLWRGYQQHGMARSYYPLTSENAVENFSAAPVRHAATDFYYRAFEADGAYYQEEYRLDEAGGKTHRLVRRMDYVMGSGNAARTYFAEVNGRLYELPLTWYTQPEKWDFSPGYAVQNKRFSRLVPDRCMACHNSYPKTIPFVEGKYEQVPHGIGCERCHGPGGLHVEERLASPEPEAEIDDTIVNPIHLDLEGQLDVCQQCHLHTTVSLLREGRGPFDFRPSQRLADHVALFSAEVSRASDQISVISHADRMKQSACFRATAGQADAMTCVTCHNPHEGFRDKGAAYFNETCLGCHASAGLQASLETPAAREDHAATANCIACHMPRVEAEEAPHASFTDHWIRVVTPEPEPARPAPVAAHGPLPLTPYFSRDRAGDEARRYEGLAYLVLGTQQADTLALEKGIAILEDVLAGHPDDQGDAHFLLGLTRLRLGRAEEAIPALEQSVRQDPDVPERLNALAQAYEATRRDPVKTERLYRRALELEPALADVRVNYGRFLEVQRRLDEAMDQYRLAIEEKPWLAEAHYNLGTGYLQQGAFDEAEAALRNALDLDPDYSQALGNLGLLYASQGRKEEARARFERAVVVAPNNATALGNLGTYHLNEDHLVQAIDLLRRAVEADPAYLDALLKLSLAYFRNDDPEQAGHYARQALALDPANQTARQILAAL